MANSPLSILKSDIDSWNRWRAKNGHAPCSLAGENLSGGYYFEGDFSHVDLSGANLERACLIGANFRHANLTGTNLSNAYTKGADFTDAILTEAVLGDDSHKSSSSRASLANAKIQTKTQAKTVEKTAPADTASTGSIAVALKERPQQLSESDVKQSQQSKANQLQSATKVAGQEQQTSQRRLFKPRTVLAAAIAISGTLFALSNVIPKAPLSNPSLSTQPNSPLNINSAPTVSPDRQQQAQPPIAPFDFVSALSDTSPIWTVSTFVRDDGSMLAIFGNQDGQIKLRDGATGELLHELTDHTDAIRSLALSPSGRRLVSGSSDGIKVWQPQTGDLLYSLPTEQGHTVWTVAISPDGQTLISGDYGGNITAWDLESGRPLYQLRVEAPVWSVAIAPDGASFVSGSSDRKLRQWDLATGDLLQEFTGHTDAVRAVALTPDGETLISGSWDSTIKLWDLATGQLITTFTGHSDRVVSLATSPDGNTLASASIDNTLKTWDLANQTLSQTLDTSDDWILTVAFDPTVRTLVSGGKDQQIKIWQ
ncbi:MAG: pentapeptide repeat-containing protein [Cyanobacteria bacterium J06606_4]